MQSIVAQNKLSASQQACGLYITYEQPLSEAMRMFLQLEFLFKTLNSSLAAQTGSFALESINTLLSILSIIDRPDIKTKLMQTLSQYTSTLSQLQHLPGIDHQKLLSILARIEAHTNTLLHQHSRFGESMKHNDLVQQLKSHSSSPGGICPHKIPAFNLLLAQPNQKIHRQLVLWSQDISKLADIIYTILEITRSSTKFDSITIERGFYQQTLDSSLPVELIQLRIPKHINGFPVFTTAKQRVAFSLMDAHDFNSKPVQLMSNYTLELSLCRV